MGANHVLSGGQRLATRAALPGPQPKSSMSRFQIQACYDRTLKTTSCSRAWSTTFRPKSSFGPTSVVGVWSTSRDSTFWRKSVVCSQIWITSPTRNVTALELDGRDGEVAVIVIVSHDADTLLRGNGLRPAWSWRRPDWRRLRRDRLGFPR